MKNVLFSFLAVFSLSANAAYIDSILITPDPALPTTGVVAEIAGDLANPSYFISNTSLTLIGDTFTLDIVSNSSGGISPSVLVSFELSESLGVLSPGTYNLVANGYIGSRLTSSLSTSFTVSSVPLPASVWLFLSGIVVLFRRNGCKRAKCVNDSLSD